MIKKANHLELSPAQVERLVEKLPMKHKLRLVDKLSKETSGTRMDKAVHNLRRSMKESSVSSREIDQICEQVKKEYDEKHRRH